MLPAGEIPGSTPEEAAGMKQLLQTSSWTLILLSWKVVGVSSARTGRRQEEECRAVLWLSRFTDWEVSLQLIPPNVQNYGSAPALCTLGAEQISGAARMTQRCCCNVPAQQHEVPNARNSFPVAQGAGNCHLWAGQECGFRPSSKHCSIFIQNSSQEVSLEMSFPTEGTTGLSSPRFYMGALHRTRHTGNIFITSKGKQTGCLDKAPNKRLMTQMDI